MKGRGQARQQRVRCEGNGSAREAGGANAQALAKQHGDRRDMERVRCEGRGRVREAAHSSCSLIGIFCAIVPPAGASKAESGTAQRARRSQPVQAGSAPGGRRSQKALNVDGERHTCTMGRACKLGGGQNVAFWKRWCVPSARWPANALWQCSLALYASQSSRSGVCPACGATWHAVALLHWFYWLPVLACLSVWATGGAAA